MSKEIYAKKIKEQKENTKASNIKLIKNKKTREYKLNKKIVKELNEKLDNLNYALTKSRMLDLVELLGNRKELLIKNIWSGIAKGIGIGIGVTIITAIIVIILQKIVTWNIPIIGEYIADIVDIVEKSK